jgi:hypothetical protein
MKIDYLKDLKEKKELVSVVLLGFSAFLAVLILVKVTGFFTAPAKAELLVKKAVAQNNTDANDMDKYFAKYKALANELKKNNLFAPPAPKQHPVKEVWGIFGDEVIIRDKLYKVGDKVGEAKIVAIEPTQVTIEWDGKKKTFSPFDAGGSSQPGGPRGSRATARGGSARPGGGSAQMVTIRSEGIPMGGRGGGMGGGMERFRGMGERMQNMSEADRDRFVAEMRERRERYMNMSEAEREKFRAEMRERFGGGRPGGGRPSGGERGPGGGRRGGR